MNREAYRKLQDESAKLLDADDLDAAEPLVNQALVAAKKLFGHTDTEVADCLLNLGMLHRSRGRFAPAQLALKQALAIYDKRGDAKSVARAYSDIANLLVYEGKYARATTFAEKAVAGYRTLDLREEDYAIALTDLGKCALESGDNDGALAAYREAFPIFEKNGAIGNAVVARGTCATALLRSGKLQEAIDDYERAIEKQEAFAGRKSPEAANLLDLLATAHSMLGCSYFEADDREAARPHFARALEIAEERGDPGVIAISLANASALAAADLDLESAARHAERAIPLAQESKVRATLASALFRRANAHMLAEQPADAIPLLTKAIAEQKAATEKQPLMLAEYQRLLGLAQYEVSDYERAARTTREALALARRHADRDSSDLANIEALLVDIYRDSDEDRKAVALLTTRVERAARTVGREHIDYADALEQLAHVYSDLDDERTAETYREVIAIRERLVPDSEDLSIACNNYALSCIDAYRPTEAVSFAERALAIATKAVGASHDTTADCWDTLARAHVAKRMFDVADDELMRAIEIREALTSVKDDSVLEAIRDALGDLEDDLEHLPRFAARAKGED